MVSAPKLTPSSSLLICRLYRCLLRAARPYTYPSPHAKVLHCFLHRTGEDDEIEDWEAYVTSDYKSLTENQAKDLTFSYGSKLFDTTTGRHTKKEGIPHPVRTYQRLFRRLLREVVTGQSDGILKMNWPSLVNTTSTLRDVIRREFRDGPNCQSIYFDAPTRKEVAFTALRELNKKLSLFDQLQKSSPKPLAEQAAWHVSALPFSPPSSYLRSGAFLVSHPHMRDSCFSKSVICILEHKDNDDDDDDEDYEKISERAMKRSEIPGWCTYGVIVNRISVDAETGTNQTLKDTLEHKNIYSERIADVFGDSVVREGGPVQPEIEMLYSLSATEDNEKALEIGGRVLAAIPEEEDSSTALYSDRATYFGGDLIKALDAVELGAIDRDDIAFFVGVSKWSSEQLESEIAQGFWIPCRGPSEIALTGICEHDPMTPSNKRPLADLWLSMLSACGEDEARLAHLFQDDDWDENGLACDDFDDNGTIFFF